MLSGKDPEPRSQTPRLYNSTKLAHVASLVCSHFSGGIRQGVEAEALQPEQKNVLTQLWC